MKDVPAYYILKEDGTPDTSKRSPEGKVFTEQFIKAFKENHPISLAYNYEEVAVKCTDRYVRDLCMQIEKDHNVHNDWNKTFNDFARFKSTYPKELRYQTREYFVDFLIDNGKYEEALLEWETTYNWEGTFNDSDIERLIKFETLLKRPVVNGFHIYCLAPIDNQLTSFGKNNRKEVLKTVEIIIENAYSSHFISRFFKTLEYENKKRLTLPKESYIQFFDHNKKFQKYIGWLNSSAPNQYCKKDGTAKNELVYLAMRSEASRLLREGENEYRLMIGAKKIGESWISETELFYKLKSAFSNLRVIHHGKPKWLGRQHFDIWFPEQNIAVEYQGAQHDQPIEFFGGDQAFKANTERDQLKKEKCRINDCFLIEVRPGYDIKKIISKIEKHLTATKPH